MLKTMTKSETKPIKKQITIAITKKQQKRNKKNNNNNNNKQ